MKSHWLLKSEPSTFSIDDLIKAKNQTTSWEGVRNYQARNFMRQMHCGDFGFFYHSNCREIGVVGMVEVVAAHPDLTQFNPNSLYYDPKSTTENPRWWMVDVKFHQKFPRLISLAELKNTPGLSGMALLKKGNRLSITPVSAKEWEIIGKLL